MRTRDIVECCLFADLRRGEVQTKSPNCDADALLLSEPSSVAASLFSEARRPFYGSPLGPGVFSFVVCDPF